MANLRTLIDLAGRSDGVTKRELEEIAKGGAAAEKVFRKLDDAANRVPRGLKVIDATAASLRGTLDGVTSRIGPLGAALKNIGPTATILTGVGVAATAAGIGLDRMARTSADNAGKIVDVADATGVATTTIQAYRLAAAGVGLTNEQVDASFEKFAKNVGDLELGTGKLSAKLKNLDPDFLRLVQSGGSIEEQFDLVLGRIRELPTEAERAALATAAFGAEGAKLALVGGTVAELTAKYGDLGALVGDDVVRAADDAGDALDEATAILRQQVGALLTEAAPAILGYEKTWVEAGTRVVAKLHDVLQAIGLINRSVDENVADLTRKRAAAQAELDKLNTDAGRGFDTTAAAARRADLQAQIDAYNSIIAAVERKAKREADAAKKTADARARDLELQRGEHAERAAQGQHLRDQDAARKKAASEATAARERALAQAERAAAETIKFEERAARAGVEGVQRVELEREQAIAVQARLLAEGAITEEDFARRRVAINIEAEAAITEAQAEETDKREQLREQAIRAAEQLREEAEERAREAGRQFVEDHQSIAAAGALFGFSRDQLAELFKGGTADAEEFAENFRAIMDDMFGEVGTLGRDAWNDFFVHGEVSAEAFWEQFKSIAADALFDLATQQIILPIVAQVVGAVGVGGGEAPAGGGGGGAFGQAVGIFQHGQQLYSLGTTLVGGFGDLVGSIGGLTGGISGLTSATAGATAAIETVGFTGVSGAAGFTGAVAPGAASFGTTGASTAATGAGIGASIGGAATTAGILLAVMGAIQGIQTGVGASKARDSFFNTTDAKQFIRESNGPLFEGIFELTGVIGGLLQVFSGGGLFELLSTGSFGFGRNAQLNAALDGKFTGADVSAFLTDPISYIPALFAVPPTKGTALRKSFEEFVEKDGAALGFFGRNSGTFARGIGQTGSLEHGGPEFLTPRQRAILGGGARGIQDELGIDIVDALNLFGDRIEDALDLTLEDSRLTTALVTLFRARVGGRAGSEETRVPGLRADVLGSAFAEGASAEEVGEIAEEGILAIGRLQLQLERLQQFVASPDNDIAWEDLRDTIAGIGIVAGGEVAQGVDKAAIALRELDRVGFENLKVEDITNKIAAANAEAAAFGGGLRDAFITGLFDANLDTKAFTEALFDQVEADFQQLIGELSFDTLINDRFRGDILGPLLQTFQTTQADLDAGKLTRTEVDEARAAALREARDAAETLKPFFAEMVDAGRELAGVFGDVADSAGDAAAAMREGFEQSIDRGILEILDPELAARLDQEAVARQRLHDARELGADLTKVYRLNELERTAIVERAAAERTQIEERRAEQIARITDSFFDSVERGLESVRDVVIAETASPSSPLAPTVTFRNAQARLDELLARAAAGDAAALEDLPGAFADAKAIAQQLYGSTEAFFDFFTPALDAMKAIGALEAESFDLSEDARAEIAAIEAESSAQLATAERHHEEAMAIYQAMLDALLIDEHGREKGTLEGDHIVRGVPGEPVDDRTTAGRYGLGSTEQRNLQSVLAGATPGGDIARALVAMLEAGGGFDETEYGRLLKAMFAGARSRDGQEDVIEAVLGKITNPSTFQPVLGFRDEGGFEVRGRGGFDTVPVSFNASPGEHVYVTTGNLTRTMRDLGDAIVAGDQREQSLLRGLTRTVESLDRRMARLESITELRQHQPKVST